MLLSRHSSSLALAVVLTCLLGGRAVAQSAGSFVISAPLRLDRTSLTAGQTLTGTVTYTNRSGAAISIRAITIAARAPGTTHTGGPFTDLTPSQSSMTVQNGASVTLTATRTFTATDALGQWESYATYRDASGVWRDGPSTFFSVTKPCTQPGSPSACSIVITSALRLDKASVTAGQTLSASVTYTNTSAAPVSIQAITIAARQPGATHTGGPFTDLTPSQQNTSLAAGSSVTLAATRAFTASDALGQWETYATYRDDANVWHDGPSQFFTVAAAAPVCVRESDQAFCARLARACGAVSGTDNCQSPRTIANCGACAAGQTCSASRCVATQTPPPPPPPPAGVMQLGTNFWYHTPNENNWSGETSMKTGINWATAYGSGTDGLAATNIWNDTFVSELAPYTTLRFMDWGNTNWSKITGWSQRMLPTDARNYSTYIDASSPANNPGMAYEWMIDLGNRTHKDVWICLPAQADPDYWSQLATLIKNKLQPDRKVYIEYSNETWNGTFGQFQYTIDQGKSQGLPGSNQWYQGQAYAVWQSLKIFKAFQDVFGASAMGTRVIRVFAYGGNMDTGRQGLRSVYNSTAWNPSGQKIDMLAIAPYLGIGLDGASANIQNDFHHAVEQVEFREDGGELGHIAFAVQDLKTFGIPRLGAYEGGQSLLKNSALWSSNPKIYDEYMYMLDRWSQYFRVFVHYAHTGKWTNAQNQSSWGALDHTGQSPSEAHKYRALVDWYEEHR